ncbi:MAG: hypothetical protein CMO26_00360 [Thiotrichales bacterium]|nr:hypothetical protein [Thiotrichales bacterium]
MSAQARQIVEGWLDACAQTTLDRLHDEHMDLISRNVSLLGVPGFEVIKFEDWSRQCKDEFDEDLVKRVRYDDAEIVAAGLSLIIFRTIETVEDDEGPLDRNGIEGTLRREDDGKWRLTQERILSEEEAEGYQLVVD